MCPDTYAPFHIGLDSNEVGFMAAQAEQLKNRKYMQSYCLATTLLLLLFSLAKCLAQKATAFFRDLGQCLQSQSGDPLSYCYLEQQITVAVQRGQCCSSACHSQASYPSWTHNSDRYCTFSTVHLDLYCSLYIIYILAMYHNMLYIFVCALSFFTHY